MELNQLPNCLCWTDIAIVEVALSLIVFGVNDCSSTSTTLIDVFVNVLECFDRYTHLDIAMCLISEREVWAVANYPFVVNLTRNIPATCSHWQGKRQARLAPAIEWIAIHSNNCFSV